MFKQKTAVLILVLGTVVSSSYGQSLWSQLDVVDGQLRQLTAGLTSLTSSVSDRESPVADRETFRLAQILDKSQGNGCKDNKIRCGNSVQCVSRILMCDGTQDCVNGADEDKNICDFPLPVGVKVRGGLIYNKCMTSEGYGGYREEYWLIKKIEQLDWFGPSAKALPIWVTDAQTSQAEVSTEIDGVSLYTAGDNSMWIDFYDGSNFMLGVCTFENWDRKTVTCNHYKRIRYGIDPPCAISKWIVDDY